MISPRGRLDSFLAKTLNIPKKAVRELLKAERVTVDGKVALEMALQIGPFSQIYLGDTALRADTPRYLMLNKPVGVVSATKDKEHKTVLDLIPEALRAGLHIVGRLDLNTSGLVLLSNDSRWSESMMQPGAHVPKEYWVTLEHPLTEDYIAAFERGFYFETEGITTLPARLAILGEREARVELCEGKYHQIKRMFGRFQNPVVALHRHRIGALMLDPGLAPGQWRPLTDDEKLACLKGAKPPNDFRPIAENP
ncbi:pseudouridine synthase [Shewanella amazonensis]|uniref:Pseudouridine synthase n=1 Tax=Shewanella amazonensis (strain ATCC BAA-1098 / SB2B) TaxID=326297 RepID=A1S9D1_SHEAM|nr:pseudouridine synthase [Shewanella amazonensis]ABM00988.1 pseudouridine synthase, Rsu [Shewanella amazonensis SB2B]